MEKPLPSPHLLNLSKEDFYYSEEGYIVFTETYLQKRGYCCKNSCKHCPYGFNNKKNILQKK
ncbi:MAG: hypothetical protein HUU48_00315 [Flavobacteriales bacterium]|nr:hypothetical protein [Flavobacteriales bacterium]